MFALSSTQEAKAAERRPNLLNPSFHEQSLAPLGFGVRQSSGALAMEAGQPKAPQDWRTPGRCRAVRRVMVPMHVRKRKRSLPFRVSQREEENLWSLCTLSTLGRLKEIDIKQRVWHDSRKT
jgi:hypothetical protein